MDPPPTTRAGSRVRKRTRTASSARSGRQGRPAALHGGWPKGANAGENCPRLARKEDSVSSRCAIIIHMRRNKARPVRPASSQAFRAGRAEIARSARKIASLPNAQKFLCLAGGLAQRVLSTGTTTRLWRVANTLARGASDERGGMVALPLAIQHRQSVFGASEAPFYFLIGSNSYRSATLR